MVDLYSIGRNLPLASLIANEFSIHQRFRATW